MIFPFVFQKLLLFIFMFTLLSVLRTCLIKIVKVIQNSQNLFEAHYQGLSFLIMSCFSSISVIRASARSMSCPRMSPIILGLGFPPPHARQFSRNSAPFSES